jgi:hypothetical protein
VAAVGIMRIMLVSVTERTGEIADATGGSAAGHPAAIPLRGKAGSCACSARRAACGTTGLLHPGSRDAPWPTHASPAAVGVTASVGLVFGYDSAYRASRLDLIETLRYE